MPGLFGGPTPSPIPHDWGASPSIDLINSRWSDHLGRKKIYDRLLEPRFRRALLKRWHFKVIDPDDEMARTELAQLRALLREVLERHAAGRPLTASMRRRLESEMNRAPLQLRFDGGHAQAALVEQHGAKRSENLKYERAKELLLYLEDRAREKRE